MRSSRPTSRIEEHFHRESAAPDPFGPSPSTASLRCPPLPSRPWGSVYTKVSKVFLVYMKLLMSAYVNWKLRALDKIGERVAKLQQLISPFGKSDTASVLSEATTYIRFLHKQIQVLSASYLQTSTVARQMEEGDYCNLRSRGLCLMPVASTLGLLKVMELSHTSRRVQLTCS